MNTKTTLTVEHLLYSLAFLVALGLRFAGLGIAPLSDFEADWALQAHQLVNGSLETIGPNPAAVLLTGTLFYLFGSGDLLARFLPAMAGSLLVFWPLALREHLGRVAALLIAFGLAFDPGLVAVSRLAGGPMLALGAFLLAWLAWDRGQKVLAGFLFALAILGGPGFWPGILAVGLASLLAAALRDRTLSLPSMDQMRPALISAGVTLLAVGTLFLRVPQGLSAMASSLPAYLQGWGGGGVPFSESLYALAVSQPLGSLLVFLGLLRLRRNLESALGFFALWLAFSFVLSMLYPGRQVYDLIWLVVPLLALAAVGLAQFTHREQFTSVTWTEAGLIFVFMAFIWLNIAAIPFESFSPDEQRLRLIVAGVVLLLAVVSTILIGLGWSFDESIVGFVWGSVSILLIYLLGTAWIGGDGPIRRANQLWWPGPAAGVSREMIEMLAGLSERHTGDRGSIEVVYQVDSPSLAWALRDFSNARFAAQLAPGELPDVLIADEGADNPFLQSVYRGQSFAWQFTRNWPSNLPANVISWIIFQESPVDPQRVILWARADIFPDGSLISNSGGAVPAPADPIVPEEELVPER